MKLKDVTLRKIKPGSKTIKLFDGSGLYLQILPSGSKGWRLKYRYAGKEKRLSLGVYPTVSLKEARARRDEMRQLLDNNIDPSMHRQAQKASHHQRVSNSFEAIGREWMEKHANNWIETNYKKILNRLEGDIFPWIGNLPITEITAPQLLNALQRVENRGALYTAHRLLNYCGQIFRYAIATGRTERDIAADLRGALPPTKASHFPAITEPKQVAELMRAIDSYQGTFIVASALKLAPLVFVRPGELRKALWTDIDFETAEWRYLVTKTDTEHVVPLATQAISILKELHPLTCHSKFVFPSARSHTRPMSDNAILAAMRRLEIPKEQMTGHGFRAMARTILDEVLNIRPDFIEHQLAHAVRDPNGRAYNRTAFLAERKNMMQQWADYLTSLKTNSQIVSTI